VTDFRDYRGIHAGATIWVVAAGMTSTYISGEFFDGKVVVAINWAGQSLGLADFHTVTNHWDDAAVTAAAYPHLPVITSDREQMPDGWVTGTVLDFPNVVMVPTVDQPYSGYSAAAHWPGGDVFTLGPTSAHLAINWATFLGAAHIVLVGVDCGELDGDHHVAGYAGNLNGAPVQVNYRLWESTLRDIAGRLRADGISVHSLNPFVSLALEDHTFTGGAA